MHKLLVCVFLVLIPWSIRAETCFTPSGKQSECISLLDCKELVTAFSQNPLPRWITNFLRQSHCGFDATGPKVCCGPLPSSPDATKTTTTTQRPTARPTVNPQIPSDPVDKRDSYPASRDICGKDGGGNRIYGGNVTDLDEYPWMALLGYETLSGTIRYECGGAMVNERYILTAAHCLTGPVLTKVGILISVRLGEYDTDSTEDCIEDDCADPPQEIRVQGSYPHPGYSDVNKDRTDDIGLVRLAKRAKINDFVKPICLVNYNAAKYAVGTAVYVAGWGKTLNGRKSSLKLKVDVPIYDRNDCFSKYKSTFNVQLTDKQLCAGGVFAKDSCTGDSGGPLMRLVGDDTWEAIAVVSFGYGCGRDGWPAVYTSVASYYDWIQGKLIETNV